MKQPGSDARPEIQGLRAVAVLLVFAFHLYPNRLSGGYVGVDVFFVISGFLITAHLIREVDRTGTVAVTQFWARRIRRLLPAALLVLATSVMMMLVWLPETLWHQTTRQVVASTLYVQNWALARDSVDYLAAGNVPTLVQHYWSLSVEEQFYLVWPVLILLLVRWHHKDARHRRIGVALGVITVISLLHSMSYTSTDPGPAYFATTTRVWEFAIGGLLAALALPRLPRFAATVAGWAGLGGIIVAAVAYSDATRFPGSAALLPALGTALVIAAGRSDSPRSVYRTLSLRPATFIGDISYGVYLWHWPLIIVAPFVTGLPLRSRDKAVIFVLTLVLAWLSTRFVEDPIRRGPGPLISARWTLVAGVTGMTLVIGLAAASEWEETRRLETLTATTTSDCVGPEALSDNTCDPVAGDGTFVVAPAAVVEQNSTPAYPSCQSDADEELLRSCILGASAHPDRTIAVVGDSHATQWFPLFDSLGHARNWEVRTFTRSSCALSLAARVQAGESTRERQLNCLASNRDLVDRLVNTPEIDTVVVAAFTSTYDWRAPDDAPVRSPATDGFKRAWSRLVMADKQVVVIRAIPLVKDRKNAPDCLMENLDEDVLACGLPRSKALPTDHQAEATRSLGEGVRLVDLTDQFCDETWCHAVVGQVVVYRDYSHVSKEYAELLMPYFAEAFDRVDRHR